MSQKHVYITVRDIRRATRRQYSAEEKIRIVLDGLRGESSIAELCRKESINQNLYYRWSKEFLEAGKKRLACDTAREANSDEVKGLRREAAQLKEALAETVLENRLLKKSTFGVGGYYPCRRFIHLFLKHASIALHSSSNPVFRKGFGRLNQLSGGFCVCPD